MARKKRSSIVLEKAERRASGMNSINPTLDLGNGMSLKSFWEDIDALHAKQKQYNALLSTVDQAYNELLQSEISLCKG